MNTSKGEWERFFPFEQIRHEQEFAINFIIDSFKGGKKYCVCELGTGVGKSAIGVTLSRWLRNAFPLSQDSHEDAGAWFLTTQKVLQEQYMRDFGSCSEPMKTIKSSNNYVCQMFDTSNFQMSCAEIHRLMAAHDFFKTMYKMCQCSCRYREEKKEFIESLDSLTNFPYFFAESNYSGQISMRQLLIVDEAHTVEEQLGKFVEVTVSEKFAKDKLKKKMPANFADLNAAVTWIRGPYKSALKKKVEEVKNLLKDPRAAEKGQVKSLTDYAKKFEILDKHMCKINRFIADFNDANWVMNVVPAQGKSMRKLVFKPVDISPYAVTHLFGYGKKVLMLSATILDKGVFCQTLGLNENDVAFLRVPSPFPVENRPIHYLPVGNMSKAKIDSTLPKMVEVVKLLLEEHKDDKGIIHCVDGSTLVSTCSGKSIPISEVLPEQLIVSWDETSKKFVNDVVVDVWSNGERDCLELEFEGGKKLICTPEHRILTKNRGWIEAQDLNENDDVVDIVHDTYMHAFTSKS